MGLPGGAPVGGDHRARRPLAAHSTTAPPQTAQALAGTTRWGSFLSDVAGFDAEFFGITPREADYIDPQQRLMLEVTVEALEHAGIPAESLQRSQTGVFVGACVSEYGFLASRDLSQVDAWTGTGGALSIIANRLSYFLDLHGPSLTVDTACSSSLVAVHLACQSLRTGQSELAIAGGVNLLLSPVVTRSFDQAEAMSPTGACHAFDAAADGFVRGEGCGVAVLKRLSDALRDGDRVLAVVRGSAVNSGRPVQRPDGAQPGRAGRGAAGRLRRRRRGARPRSTTSRPTAPARCSAIPSKPALWARSTDGDASPDAPLLVGAAKTNLGHLEAAAGIVGLIKAALAVQRGEIPPNQHFDNPNPHIPFDELRSEGRRRGRPRGRRPGDARRAGVSSFGFGGTNAHVVLEQAPQAPLAPAARPQPAVTTLVVSGKSPERLAATAGDAGRLDDRRRRRGSAGRRRAHPQPPPHAPGQCSPRSAPPTGTTPSPDCGRWRPVSPRPAWSGPTRGPCGPGTVFVYSGQGSQWAGMGRQLLADEPAFADAVAALEPDFVGRGRVLAARRARGRRGADRRSSGSSRCWSGIQLALTALWRSYRVEPDAVIGHSMGEVTAAVVAGALTPAEGLRVIATRSQLMARLRRHRRDGPAGTRRRRHRGADRRLPRGDGGGVRLTAPDRRRRADRGRRRRRRPGREQNTFARRVNVDVASHHAMMDPILPELKDALADLVPGFPVIPIISTVENAGDAPQFDADHWVANLRNPVRFSDADRRRRRHQQHLHRDQPAPAAHQGDLGHPR